MKNILLLSFCISLFNLEAQVSNSLDAKEDINCENQIYNTRELQQFAYNSHCKAEAYPFLSDNGSDLYFTADHSYHWLFYTNKDSVTQVWSVPVPIQVANYTGSILSSYFSRDLTELYFTNNSSEVFHCKSINGSKTQFSQPVQLKFSNPNNPNDENAFSPFSSLSFLDDFNKLYAVISDPVSGLGKLSYFLKLSKKSITTIKMSFALSIIYNIIGLSFAITGNLLPLVAAIIMPLSTVTIISFTSIATHMFARKNKLT